LLSQPNILYYDHASNSRSGDSKRVSQRTEDGFRQFVYQGPDCQSWPQASSLQLERDEGEQTVAQYTMGSGLEAVRRDSTSSSGPAARVWPGLAKPPERQERWLALALTGADEAVTDTYRHDARGVLLASTGSTVNPHTYVGRERYYRMPNADMYHLMKCEGTNLPPRPPGRVGNAPPPDPLPDLQAWPPYDIWYATCH